MATEYSLLFADWPACLPSFFLHYWATCTAGSNRSQPLPRKVLWSNAPPSCFQLDSFNSRMASPAPLRLASLISEYLRERSTPGAPARNAASTAALTLCGVHLLWLASVGMSISMPGQI